MGRHGRRAGQGLRWVHGGPRAVRYRRSVTYAVSTPVFEGPIDLLLHLVSSHEVDVLDIPLLPVVDAFVRVLTAERDLLLARLLECRAYSAAADVFVALAERASRSIPREVGLDDSFVIHAPDLLAGVTPEDIAQAYLHGS